MLWPWPRVRLSQASSRAGPPLAVHTPFMEHALLCDEAGSCEFLLVVKSRSHRPDLNRAGLGMAASDRNQRCCTQNTMAALSPGLCQSGAWEASRALLRAPQGRAPARHLLTLLRGGSHGPRWQQGLSNTCRSTSKYHHSASELPLPTPALPALTASLNNQIHLILKEKTSESPAGLNGTRLLAGLGPSSIFLSPLLSPRPGGRRQRPGVA